MNSPTSTLSRTYDLLFFTVKDVAAILQISRSTVYNLIKTGELKAVQIGRAIRVRKSDLDEYISNNSTNHKITHRGDKDEDKDGENLSLCWPATYDLDRID